MKFPQLSRSFHTSKQFSIEGKVREVLVHQFLGSSVWDEAGMAIDVGIGRVQPIDIFYIDDPFGPDELCQEE